MNQEIKRRSRTVEIFPCESAILRLVGALWIEQNDDWAVARIYLNLVDLARVCDADKTDSGSDRWCDPTVRETGNRSQIRLAVIPRRDQSLGV